MDNFIYCLREQALRENERVYFKIGHANDLDRRKSCMQTANPRLLRFVFVLGPFLDRDEAEDVESQAHQVLAKHRVRGEWFDTNPLAVPEFLEWIDAQLLPICVQEKSAIPQKLAISHKSIGMLEYCRKKADDLIRGKKPVQQAFDLGEGRSNRNRV